MSEPELKACPFCGVPPESEAVEDDDFYQEGSHRIRCVNDDCYVQPRVSIEPIGTEDGDAAAQAAMIWNHRAAGVTP